jgi:putative flippase GtrA
MKRFLNRSEIIRFVITGIISVVIDFSVYQALLGIGIPRGIAKSASFFFGAAVGFVINKLWTFGSDKGLGKEIPRYVLLYASTAVINAIVNAIVLRVLALAFFAEIIGLLPLRFDAATILTILAFLCATGVSMVLNFLGLKLFVFSNTYSEG